jgi:hypothetical protein
MGMRKRYLTIHSLQLKPIDHVAPAHNKYLHHHLLLSHSLQASTMDSPVAHGMSSRVRLIEYPASLAALPVPTAEMEENTVPLGIKVFMGGLRFELVHKGKRAVSWFLSAVCGITVADDKIIIHRRRDKDRDRRLSPPTGCVSVFVGTQNEVTSLIALSERLFCGSKGVYIGETVESVSELIQSRAIIDVVDGKVRGPTHPIVIEIARNAEVERAYQQPPRLNTSDRDVVYVPYNPQMVPPLTHPSTVQLVEIGIGPFLHGSSQHFVCWILGELQTNVPLQSVRLETSNNGHCMAKVHVTQADASQLPLRAFLAASFGHGIIKASSREKLLQYLANSGLRHTDIIISQTPQHQQHSARTSAPASSSSTDSLGNIHPTLQEARDAAAPYWSQYPDATTLQGVVTCLLPVDITRHGAVTVTGQAVHISTQVTNVVSSSKHSSPST